MGYSLIFFLNSHPTAIFFIRFTLDDGQTSTSVVQYFRQKYNLVLKHPNLPCLQAGSVSKPVYLPMEV